ncbi:33887_t:CDS:2, partial [Gigaspora margarita]
MQEIIRIAEDFYAMNHITINGKKTKLLVFNSKFKSQQQTIAIAKELIKAERNEQLVRFLGTWINTKFNEKLIKSKARSIVTQATKALIGKSDSPDSDFALLRLKQGIILANIDRKFCQDRNWDSLKKIWKFNLT